MTTKDEALKQALEALKLGAAMYSPAGTAHAQIAASIAACREALAQKDEQEPVLWRWVLRSDPSHCGYYTQHPSKFDIDMSGEKYDWTPFYTAPPKCKPLTDEKLRAMWANYAPIVGGVLEFARAIEAAHGIGAEHEPR